MTWVVGTTSIFGYGVLLSDIQVTCGWSGVTFDVLQKSFPVGKYIAAGFAGDVRAGLWLIDSLRAFLNVSDTPHDECWEPAWVAQHWAVEAKLAYAELAATQEVGATEIVLVGAQPEFGAQPRIYGDAVGQLTIFRSPDFEPESSVGGQRVVSIGSGNGIDAYTEELEYLVRDPERIHIKGELMGGPGGHARMIAFSLQRAVAKNPTPGISSHFHLTVVRLGSIGTYRTPDMPPVATNLAELSDLIHREMNTGCLIASTELSEASLDLPVRRGPS